MNIAECRGLIVMLNPDPLSLLWCTYHNEAWARLDTGVLPDESINELAEAWADLVVPGAPLTPR